MNSKKVNIENPLPAEKKEFETFTGSTSKDIVENRRRIDKLVQEQAEMKKAKRVK